MKLLKTAKETFYASIPLAVIIVVCLLCSPLDSASDYFRILVGYLSVIVGQSLFLVGLEGSILPIGHFVGSSFSKYNKILFVCGFGFAFGLLATVAEPALAVLARQIFEVLPIINPTLFIWITGVGIGIGVAIALLRMVKSINIKAVFSILYGIVFLLVIFAPPEFIAIAFDGSGATTGDVSVPFILALGIGISASFSKYKTQEDSFGIIGISSVGPIIAVLLYGMILKGKTGTLPEANSYHLSTESKFFEVLAGNVFDIALAVLPIVVISIPFLLFVLHLPRREFFTLMIGVLPVYFGLLIFLTGIDFGFAFIGQYIGQIFFSAQSAPWLKWLLLPVGFVLGAAITVSEPAVTVLGIQIEDLTNGHIKQMTIRVTLALGIGAASLLCVLKILTSVNILVFLVPLYILSIAMMWATPKLFVGLAFDSGGVTGGALSSAFLTPLTLGIAQAVAESSGKQMSVLENGFGIISFISVTPLIAIQALGMLYHLRSHRAEQLAAQESYEELLDFVNAEQLEKPIQNEGGTQDATQ